MAKDTQKAVPLTEEQLIEREVALKIAEQELSDKQEHLVLEQNKFEEKKSAFEIEKSNLEREKADLEKEKTALNDREKAEEKAEKIIDPISFEFEGEKYQFSTSAPQSILMNGKGISQKEIAKDDELKLQLIGSNSSLILKK